MAPQKGHPVKAQLLLCCGKRQGMHLLLHARPWSRVQQQVPLAVLGAIAVYHDRSQLLGTSARCLCVWFVEPKLWQPRPGG